MYNTSVFLRKKGRIRVKAQSIFYWMLAFISFWPVLLTPISKISGPLGYIKYLPDGVLLLFLVLSLKSGKIHLKRYLLSALQVVGCLFLYALLVYVFQYQSAAYFLWGFRNVFRFYIAFFAYIKYFDQSGVDIWFEAMDVVFWVNAILSIYQFFFLGVYGDYLGGIFGISGATNGYTLVLLTIVVSLSLLRAFTREEKLWLCCIKCTTAILLAAMVELKVFFLMFVVVLVLASALTQFSWKKLLLLICAAVLLVMGAWLFSLWYENMVVLDFQRIWETATQESYSSSGDVNRLSAIGKLTRLLDMDLQGQLFGMGLGNCDTSSFAICNTPFYKNHSSLHYNWFSSAMTFLELGYLGMIIYLSFFVTCIWRAWRCVQKHQGSITYCQLTVIIGLMCFVLFFYNSSLRNEAGYMVYFVMALPFMKTAPEKPPVKGEW